MDLLTRRTTLGTTPNPNSGVDYVASLAGRLTGGGPDLPQLIIKVRYVPDRLIIKPDIFIAYLRTLGASHWDSMEACAVALLDDFNNEIVPRWLQVVMTAQEDLTGCLEHEVIMDDKQPNWENPGLLSRLKRY